jgi:hypothetical protein
MTKKELIEKLQHCNDDDEIVIQLHQSGIGGTSCTKILNASRGIDWDNGKVLLRPEIPVVTQEHLDRIQKYSRVFEHLLYLYALENNLKYAGQPLLGSEKCVKGSVVRVFKDEMKKHVDEYLNPKDK